MARDSINVHLPAADRSNSVEFIEITKQAVTQANGIEILYTHSLPLDREYFQRVLMISKLDKAFGK